MKILSLALLMILMTGCATTKMQTHIDPEHRGRTYSKILVDAPNANFEFKDLMIAELCSGLRKKSVECIAKDELFPPTRKYSEPRFFEIIDQNGIDGWLIVGIGSGVTSSQYMGSQTFGYATVYGNTISGSANSMAMYSFNRQQGYSIAMFDMETNHKAFIMEASTSASGLANITNSVFAESLANKIINEMSAAGFIE
ncbi:hypothetical protein [Marinobacter shengliensis]|uniref:hypothetical protein n=1 Tax=Marinobacter shengliensis TaxID=1389223 RepID=UPI0035BB29DF